MKTQPLTDTFGLMVDGIDLQAIDHKRDFPEIRDLFEQHSALLFKRQAFDTEAHKRLAQMFGPIEDRLADERKKDEAWTIPLVSNVKTDGGVTGEMDLHTLHLKANQLWHSDSTFMPRPALCNILAAKVVTTTGGQTDLASTRAAWAAMPETLRARVRGKILGHSYATSRRKISAELAQQAMFNKWPPQRWPAVWVNPVTKQESLYIASHVFEVEGLEKEDGAALIEELTTFCTQERFVYSHSWEVGDVLLWDQRSVMHRGTPWPYDQPRTLASICCSMQDEDGLTWARQQVKET